MDVVVVNVNGRGLVLYLNECAVSLVNDPGMFFSIVFDVQTSRFLNGFVNRFKNKLKPTFPNMTLTAVYVCVWGGGCMCVCVCVNERER